jgi:hypothetical protein
VLVADVPPRRRARDKPFARRLLHCMNRYRYRKVTRKERGKRAPLRPPLLRSRREKKKRVSHLKADAHRAPPRIPAFWLTAPVRLENAAALACERALLRKGATQRVDVEAAPEVTPEVAREDARGAVDAASIIRSMRRN